MKMEGWEDHLHLEFLGEHVLFSSLQLKSPSHFVLASLLTLLICWSERLLTLALAKHWSPFRSTRRSRLRNALWRTGLYWIVTLERLLYMLLAMTFHVGILIVTVTALAMGQFAIEYLDSSGPHSPAARRDSYRVKEPLLGSSPASQDSVAMKSIQSRPRSKSKPHDIFIHPNDSNLARADVVALEMGLAGDTERVKGNNYPEDEDPWESGKGRDVARALLSRPAHHNPQQNSEQHLFSLEDESSEEGRSS